MRLVWSLALIGCGASVGGGGPDGSGTEPPAPLTVQVDAASGFDPVEAPLAVTVRTEPGASVVVELADEGGAPVATLEGEAGADGALALTWDARDGGAFWPAARYTASVVATLGDREGEGSAAVAVLRAGFVAARLEGDGGVTALREPLFWPVERILQDEGEPISTLDRVDEDGEGLDFFPVATGNLALRPSAPEPVAFRYDARPILVLDPADESEALGEVGLSLAEVAVSADGWQVLSGSPLQAGTAVVLQLAEPLGDTVGVSELDVVLGFSVDGVRIGEQHLPLTVFRLLDASQFERAEPAYRPWAPVVAQALPAIEGSPASHGAVTDALVEWIYFDLGLVYDTRAGASAYSTYDGFSWDRPHFYLSDFLVRRYGATINCSDAGNILGAYANMVGARLDHLIIDPSFDLNRIKAIGQDEYTACPFGPWGCGFSYHAVTTLAGSMQIWDATLALDGDADPYTPPETELLVQSIDAVEYLDRLVRSGNPSYGHMAQETLE